MTVLDLPRTGLLDLAPRSLIDPRGVVPGGGQVVATGPQDLKGKRVAIVTHGYWRSWEIYRERLEAFWSTSEQGVAHERRQDDRPHTDERYDEIVANFDAAVVGLGNCGSCTLGVVIAAMDLASRGLPVAVAVTSGFRSLAEGTLSAKGYGHVPVVLLPAAYEVMADEEIIRIADEQVSAMTDAFAGRPGA